MRKYSKQLISMFAIAFAALVLSGCGATPVKDVESSLVPSNVKSSEQVKQAIVRAGAQLGWGIKEVDNKNLQGTLMLRKHVAQISIPYSAKEYSLIHKTSENLKYNAADNTIHKNYNSWIENLDRAIQVQLLQQ